MNRLTESTPYSHHVGWCTFSPVVRGRLSTGQLLRRRIDQGDAELNDVNQLLQHFSSFVFDRFGRWINRSQSPHSKAADLPSFVWIGTEELRQRPRVGGSLGSFTSLFSICSSIHLISVQRLFEWRFGDLAPASGRNRDQSTETFRTFKSGPVSGLFTRRPIPRVCR
jgi:hypothetical protein